MKASAAYALQLTGLVVVGAGLAVGLGQGAIRLELLLLALGGGAFVLGRALGRGQA